MFQRILVPLDGSSFAEAALSAAIAVARRTDGAIRLVHVLDPVRALIEEQAAADRERAEVYFDSLGDRIRRAWAGSFSTSIRQGRVAEELGAEVKEWQADLLAMSTHGRSGISRLWMGSVADRCVRSAGCPVLLVRPKEDEAFDPVRYDATRIVVPLDGSLEAELALPHAVLLARAFAAQALVLRVVTQPGGYELLNRPEAIVALSHARDQDRVEADEYVEQRVADLRELGLDGSGVVWTETSPAEAIAARAEGDWVVMSTNGRSGFQRAFFGSVADKVVRSSSHPVIVVPPPRREHRTEVEAPGETPAEPRALRLLEQPGLEREAHQL